jgi:Flp pilus assembly protein TadD
LRFHAALTTYGHNGVGYRKGLCMRGVLSVCVFAALIGSPLPLAAQQAAPAANPQLLLRTADRMKTQGDLAGAANLYQQVLAQDASNRIALAGLAELLAQSGQAAPALDLYQRWASLSPEDAQPWLAMARLHNRIDQPRDAAAALDEAMRRNANPVLVLTERGIALDLAGAFRPAQASYQEALKLAPKNLLLTQKLALSYALAEQYELALPLLQQVANDPAGAVAVRNTLAMVYALSGQGDAAVKIAGLAGDGQQANSAMLRSLGNLSARDKARAVHLGIVPAPAPISPAPPVLPTVDPAAAPKPAPVQTAAAPTPAPKLVPLPQVNDDGSPAVETPAAAAATGAAGAAVRAVPLPPGDRHWAQLAVLVSRKDLTRSWDELMAKANGALDGMTPYLQPTMIGGRQVVRLVVGGYSDASTARALIARLKANGVNALLNRNAAPADPLFP